MTTPRFSLYNYHPSYKYCCAVHMKQSSARRKAHLRNQQRQQKPATNATDYTRAEEIFISKVYT